MHVFAYGTLMATQVWDRVVAGSYENMTGRAEGFRRLCVIGEEYPGLVEVGKGSFQGVVYLDVGEDDLQRLDYFEGEEYKRVSIPVVLENGDTITCQTYLFKDKYRHKLTDREWLYDCFLKKGMKSFLSAYSGWEER